ncbi:hypothetical protein BU23DRAFT_318319 [Bimuria novae-zelandiae CBS 107.79]|uniref:Uncharacterized protein n=1 Tax=Bimuria novae-zelandiae CBS 107.79 TaxID=1447943 RepID=A0A6A5VMU5_9PLEO|nr:hypothetical protein BU23DRAFT_318319 [Bimuria novae-zelandiae CBS 107.79]
MASRLSFLDLPKPLRYRIYTYLLAPHLDGAETVVNYDLKWNWLENPSNTTFAGIPQVDLCRCPRQKRRTQNSKTEDHMYTRYKCNGPEVRFKSGQEDLWVPSSKYANSGQINFLRPARDDELSRRPNANILSVCRTVYEEALPVLYHGRDFLFVTGPCPRGRYQAYATHIFFARLSSFARSHVTAFSLTVVPHEEDCTIEDVGRAYADLAAWVQRNLPSFQTLGISFWDGRLKWLLKPFEELLQNDGVKIELDRGQRDGWVKDIENARSFRSTMMSKSNKTEGMHVEPLQEEELAEGPSNVGYVADASTSLEAFLLRADLTRARRKEKSTLQPDSEEDEEEWFDVLPTPTTPKEGRAEGEEWDLV